MSTEASAKVTSVQDEEAPNMPSKERSPSPDQLLQEEPLESEAPIAPTTPAVRPGGTLSTASSGIPPHARVDDDEEAPPPKPPRPVSQFDRDVTTLKEAFPEVELAVVKAVLTASGGKVEPAFNALLGMSDPSFVAEEEHPPPQPPRPTGPRADFQNTPGYDPAPIYHDPSATAHQTSTPLTQLEADELYARQLAQHYGGATPSTQPVRPLRTRGDGQQQQRKQQIDGPAEPERSFLDDDLPVITENIKKGFMETQSKVNKWVEGFRKRLDGDDIDTSGSSQGQPNAASRANQAGQQSYPQRQSSRRSGDNYDADPRVLEDDFSHLEMRDNTGDARSSSRPLANPNLFSSTATTGGSAPAPAPRRVSFQEQSDDDLYRQPTPRSTLNSSSTQPASTMRASSPTPAASGTSKWAPLATVEPTPLNSDPFSLGDSDDEHDAPPVISGKTGPQETGTVSGGPTPK